MKFALAVLVLGSVAVGQTTTRVSVDSNGIQSAATCWSPSISADGRYIAFWTYASNLVAGDTNTCDDVFVRDTQTGTTERVSVASGGAQANYNSEYPSISADGRFVAFMSNATDLVVGDTNGGEDIFVHDRLLRTTERVSVDSTGAQASGSSWTPCISGDGRYVSFSSDAPDLVAGDTNGCLDVFVHDRVTGVTQRVSVDTSGVQGNSNSGGGPISADGRFVLFDSAATNLVVGDTNAHWDVFVHDRQTGVTERVSIASSGGQGSLDSGGNSISADGRFVAFNSGSPDLVPGDSNGLDDVYVHDRQSGTTERVSVATGGSEANGASDTASLSADGRFAVFPSFASNLVPNDSNGFQDVFLRDRQFGTTQRVSISTGAAEANSDSTYWPSISGDGRRIAFQSSATNLILGDTNSADDIFVRDRGTSDCNGNGIDDAYDIQSGISSDCNGNVIPDECDLLQGASVDCDGNGLLDACEIAGNPSLDADHDGVLDSCPQACVASWHRYVGGAAGADNTVASFAVCDLGVGPALFMGGTFLTVNGVAASRVATWNGQAWAPLGIGLTGGPVTALRGYSDGQIMSLYAVGGFTSAGGIPVHGLARWNGTAWSALPTSLNTYALCLAEHDSGGGPVLYIGGYQGLFSWDGVSVAPIAIPGVFSPTIKACTSFVDAGAHYLYVGGYDGNNHSFMARWDGASWSVSTGAWLEIISAFGTYDDGSGPALFAGISDWSGTAYGTVARVIGTQLGAQIWNVDGGISALGAYDDGSGASLYACGRFGQMGGGFPVGIAKWNGSAWSQLGTGLNGTVYAITSFDDGAGTALYVGGEYTAVGTLPALRVATWRRPSSCTTAGTAICEPSVGGSMPCPCSNPPSGAGRGCNNSSGTGGSSLATTGIARLGSDTLSLTTSAEKPGALSIVLQGTAMNTSGSTFGQGVRCVAGSLKRLYIKSALGGTITAPGAGDPTLSARSASLGDVIAQGMHRFYGVYYRDPVVLGGCPATSTFNMTQQLDVLWHP